MILETLFWLVAATAILGIIIFLAEIFKDEKSRNGLVVGMAILSIVFAGVALLLITGTSDDIDINYGLDKNQIYYLNATAQDPANPQTINLIVFKTDTITGEIAKPAIIMPIQKSEIAQGVEPGKYIFRNAQGQIEIWTQPIKT
ncbi:MAG: hypothetical protein WC788_07770 [Candidatus Paceibacterota bacterium]|jgi:hypothetical protein